MDVADGRLTEQQVRERAYFIWEREGRPDGRDREHWAMAERELFVAGLPAGTVKPASDGGNGAARPKAPAKPKATAKGEAAGKAKTAPRKRAASTAKAAARTAQPKTRGK